ncbi:MAG TPA: DCC1-like thiol-disulfide oxidoreductase family protein [Pyrinomonadaceae bacterium]|nr:DCC1-like thiol-disulfide oxidoreductase family protein [Pyrinomonadaceae bacterium]
MTACVIFVTVRSILLLSDKKNFFKFAPLQSEIGQKYIEKFSLSGIDSVVLIEDERAFAHSTAALKIAKSLGGFWSVCYIFIIIPRPIRDFFYKLFAKYRYRLFGKQDACMLPTPEIREKFLK